MKAWCHPRQVLVRKRVKCPIINSATACINGASSILSSQLLAKCSSNLKQEHRKSNSAVAQHLAAATGNVLEGCFSAVQ